MIQTTFSRIILKSRGSPTKLFFGAGYNKLNLICCNQDGSPISPTTWNHSFKRLLKQNNLPDIRIHDLRHTNASLMLKHGVSMKVASERLGHTTIGITMDLYSHIDEEQQKDAAEKINNAFKI